MSKLPRVPQAGSGAYLKVGHADAVRSDGRAEFGEGSLPVISRTPLLFKPRSKLKENSDRLALIRDVLEFRNMELEGDDGTDLVTQVSAEHENRGLPPPGKESVFVRCTGAVHAHEHQERVPR